VEIGEFSSGKYGVKGNGVSSAAQEIGSKENTGEEGMGRE
jgi:hypothetical protein